MPYMQCYLPEHIGGIEKHMVLAYGGGSRGYRAYLLTRSDFSNIAYDYIVVHVFTTSDICAI